MRTVSAHHPHVRGTFALAVHEADDAFISTDLAMTGCWEPLETEVLARLIDAAHAHHRQRRPLVVDGGANIGWYSVVAGLLGADVVAAEPMPANADLLEYNVDRNGVRDRVTVCRTALGANDGVAALHLSPTNQGDHRLHLGATTDPAKRKTIIEVRVTRLDALLHDRDPDVIKLDTQGSEVGALRGLTAARDEVRISAGTSLLTEFWPYGLGRCGASASDFLALIEPCIGVTHECFVLLEASSVLVPADRISLRRLSDSPAMSERVRGFVNLALVPLAHSHVLNDLVDHSTPFPFL